MPTMTKTRKVAATGVALAGLAMLMPGSPAGADTGRMQGCDFDVAVYPGRVYGGANAYTNVRCDAGRLGYVQLLQEQPANSGNYVVVATSSGFAAGSGVVSDNAFLANAPTGNYKAKLVLGSLAPGTSASGYTTLTPVFIK